MAPHELVDILARMNRDGKAKGEAATMIHLFGIKYADKIRGCGESPHKIAELATGHHSYGTEINKGMNLARYVRPLAIAAFAAIL